MKDKERFLEICKNITREGIDDLIKWLEDGDFYTAPASAKYHLAVEGGLLRHSLNVYDELKRLLSAYPEVKASDETAAIIALFHDLCKINLYVKESRNRKNKYGKWESYECYSYDEKFCYGGHGSKSVYLAGHFIKLTPEEATAIQCHMSSWEDGASKQVGSAYEQFPLAWLLHVADESATFILETEELKENEEDKGLSQETGI